MANSGDWSDEGREGSPSKGKSSKKKSGPPALLRILSPISNAFKKGGKIRSKKKREKARS
jgi:hypothetical protein